MTQDELWEIHFRDLKHYMETFKRRPSKHRLEDHRMLNWIKYNKKMMKQGKLSEERVRRFDELMTQTDKYRKLNQYSYITKSDELSSSLFT